MYKINGDNNSFQSRFLRVCTTRRNYQYQLSIPQSAIVHEYDIIKTTHEVSASGLYHWRANLVLSTNMQKLLNRINNTLEQNK